MMNEWEMICNNLQKTLKAGDYKVWITPLQGRVEGATVYIQSMSTYVRTCLQKRFMAQLQKASSLALNLPIEDIELVFNVAVAETNNQTQRNVGSRIAYVSDQVGHDGHGYQSRAEYSAVPSQTQNVQISLPMTAQSPLTRVRWKHTFDDFVVGSANAFAVAAAHDICRQQGNVETLFVSAPSGLGKTHLLYAIGQNFSKDGGQAQVGYLTSEDFTSHFVSASRHNQMDAFKASLRDLDVLLLEDVHWFQGKEKTQNEALATIKCLQTKGKKVVLTSSFSPKELHNVDSQLVSHFCSGLLTSIEKPTQDMCRNILIQKAQKLQVQLPQNVVDVLVGHLHHDVRQLESCLTTLCYKAKLLQTNISIELALDVLSQFMPMGDLLNMERIVNLVCASFKLTEKQLTSRSRNKEYVLARDTVYYLARKHTDATLEEIGQRFNRRHSTVVKGISTIERQLQSQSSSGRQVANTLQLVEKNAGIAR